MDEAFHIVRVTLFVYIVQRITCFQACFPIRVTGNLRILEHLLINVPFNLFTITWIDDAENLTTMVGRNSSESDA